MKKTVNIKFFIICGIIFIFLYLLLALKPLAREYQLTPDWTINISTPASKKLPESRLIKYHLGQNAGYFTEDGTIILSKSFPSKVTISDTNYCFYDTNSINSAIFDISGNQSGKIQTPGFPMLSNNKLFIFLPGGSSFTTCETSGNPLWTFENTMPITAFSSKNNFTAVGLADGTIILNELDTGKKVMEYMPGGSDYPVILGLDISETGDYIASVSGQNKQRFVLARREGKQPKIVYHEFLDSDSINRTFVYFCKDNSKVLYNYGKKLGIIDLVDNKKTEVQLQNRIISAKETEKLIFLLGKDGSNYTVYILEKSNVLEGNFSFKASSAFIETSNEQLFIGKDNFISRITINRE